MLSNSILLLSIGQQPSEIEAILLLCPEPLLTNGQQPSNIEAIPIFCPHTDTQKPLGVPKEDPQNFPI